MWLWAIILCGYFIYDSLSVRISQTKLRLKSSTTKQEGVKVRLFINVHFSLRQNEINFPFRRAETAQIWSRFRDVSRKSYEKVEVLENLYFVKIHKKECFALSLRGRWNRGGQPYTRCFFTYIKPIPTLNLTSSYHP